MKNIIIKIKQFIMVTMAVVMCMATPMTSFAQAYQTYSAAGDNVYTDLNSAAASNQFFINGNYAILKSTGNVYYYPNGVLFTDGIADDGNVYDEYGVQQYTAKYVYDKCINNSNNGSISVNGMSELELIMGYYQVEHGARQGAYYNYDGSGDNLSITSYEVNNFSGTLGESYYNAIAQFASQVDRSQSVEDQVTQVRNIVGDFLTYDTAYRNYDMERAIQVRGGVCYHYSKLTSDTLDYLGIYNETMRGSYDGAGHVWVRAWDNEQNRWIYLECTGQNRKADTVNNYADYIEHYRQYTYATVK